MLPAKKYRISAFSGIKNHVKIFIRSKVILVWSWVKALLVTFERVYHIWMCVEGSTTSQLFEIIPIKKHEIFLIEIFSLDFFC